MYAKQRRGERVFKTALKNYIDNNAMTVFLKHFLLIIILENKNSRQQLITKKMFIIKKIIKGAPCKYRISIQITICEPFKFHIPNQFQFWQLNCDAHENTSHITFFYVTLF